MFLKFGNNKCLEKMNVEKMRIVCVFKVEDNGYCG